MKSIIIILSISMVSTFANAQWMKTNSPNSGSVNCFANSGTDMIAGTDSGGTFLSSNNGNNWSAVVNGLTTKSVKTLASNGTTIFAGTLQGGVFLSTNNGSTWTSANTGLTNTNINSLAVSGTNIFAGTDSGIYISANNGGNWSSINSGLSNLFINAVVVNGSNIFAGTYGGGVFLSTNNGSNWNAVNTGLTSDSINALVFNGSDLYASTYSSGVFISSDNGSNWTALNTGLTNTHVWAIATFGSNVFVGTGGGGKGNGTGGGTGGGKGKGGVFKLTNNTWAAVNTGLPKTDVRSLAINGTTMFAGMSDGNVWKRDLSEMTTAIAENMANYKDFKIYPNPSNTVITIQYNIEQKETINIYNTVGELIYKSFATPAETQFTINISEFAKGFYFVKIGHETRRFIKD